MKTLKAMQALCILGMIGSITRVDQNKDCWIVFVFFTISFLFFISADNGKKERARIQQNKDYFQKLNDLYEYQQSKAIRLENDLYEHSNY